MNILKYGLMIAIGTIVLIPVTLGLIFGLRNTTATQIAIEAQITAEAQRDQAEYEGYLARSRELAALAQSINDPEGNLDLLLARETIAYFSRTYQPCP